jgi:hypothetical protein
LFAAVFGYFETKDSSHAAAVAQVASPHIKAQWAWASACNLIKMTSVRPEAFPVSALADACVHHVLHLL